MSSPNSIGASGLSISRSGLFTFPNPVNEVAARVVAAGVAVLSVTAIAADLPWMAAVLAYGFLARVAAGPRFSPLGLLATKVVVPRLRLPNRPVPGPPKRFAQAIGATFSLAATVLALVLSLPTAAFAVLGVLALFATLEAAAGLCMGCRVFAVLMRLGVIPETVCERCNNITARPPAAASASPS